MTDNESTTLTLPYHEAVAAAKIVYTGTAMDTVTPVLMLASWERESNRLVATDRYCVVTYEITGAEVEGDQPILIPRDLLLWVGKLKPTSHEKVRITVGERTITAEVVSESGHASASQVAERVVGNFPPVARLFDAWSSATDAGPVGLSPKLLKQLLMPLAVAFKTDPLTFELGQSEHEYKSAPVRITKGPVKILVQPSRI